VAVLTPQFPRRPWTLLAWREVSRDQDAKRENDRIPENAFGQRR
jgi:hypothetical protein